MVRLVLSAIVAIVLAGCGGGGGDGGGGGSGTGSLTVSLIDTSVSWSAFSPAFQAKPLRAAISGTYSGQVFVQVRIENAGTINAINSSIPVVVTPTDATATVVPEGMLPAGTHTGRLVFLACSDAACTNRIGGTPLFVPFSVQVLAGVSTTPANIITSSVSGTAPTFDVAVQLGANESDYDVTSNAPFAQISNKTPAGFRLTLASLPAGNYPATLALRGSAGSTAALPINYTTTIPPGGEQGLSATPNSVTLSTYEGGVSAEQLIQVTEPTWRPGLQTPSVLHFSSDGWITLTRVEQGYRISGNASGLAPGAYSGSVTIITNSVAGKPAEAHVIPVQLAVTSGLIAPSPVAKIITSESVLADLAGTVTIGAAAPGAAIPFTAISTFNQLNIAPSGVTGSPLAYSFNRDWLGYENSFEENCGSIIVTADPPSTLAPLNFLICLTSKLAEVTGLAPGNLIRNQAERIIVRGRGFDGVTNLPSRLRIGNAIPISVQRVNDTELVVNISGMVAGSHDVTISNALNLARRSFYVTMHDPQVHTYATVATDGRIDVLVPHQFSSRVIAVNRSAGTLTVFARNGAGWSATPVPIANVNNVGILPGNFGIATTTDGDVRTFNPLNATVAFNFKVAECTFASLDTTAGVLTTNEGKSWIATRTTCDGPQSFNILSTLQSANLPLTRFGVDSTSNQFFEGPDMVMSGDGERMLLRPSRNMNTVPMQYFDAKDLIVHEIPGDDARWYDMAISNVDGSKMLLDADRLLDAQFNIIGRVQLPNYAPNDVAYAAATVFAPDGNRAYVLTYRIGNVGLAGAPVGLPRVYVLNTTSAVGNQPLPVLGYFELADYPSCLNDTTACAIQPAATISLDGNTLFFAGSERMVIAPIPAMLTPVGS